LRKIKIEKLKINIFQLTLNKKKIVGCTSFSLINCTLPDSKASTNLTPKKVINKNCEIMAFVKIIILFIFYFLAADLDGTGKILSQNKNER